MCKCKMGEYQMSFNQKINRENSKRLMGILIVIMLISGVQAALYIIFGAEYYGWKLIGIKFCIVIGVAILLIPLNLVKNGNAKLTAISQHIINLAVISMLLLAIFNTFFAQNISSDISIYIMMLFVTVAAVRMKPSLMACHLIFSFAIFVVGITAFQSNQVYRSTHIVNGFLMNMVAFLISVMFYHYSSMEYKDKLDIDAKNLELKRISDNDELTSLYNNRAANHILEQMIERAKTTKETIFLGILDLDNFKDINDRYGHAYGDEVLKLIAKKIMDNISCDDTAGRFGGDEFILIFKEATEEHISIVMNKLLNDVRSLNFRESKLTFSCGIAKWNGESKEKLFERADHYMYLVKNSGRNNILLEMKEIAV
ncbi:MAG: GGDEF domain-containing protein [Mobilitalea sp.]